MEISKESKELLDKILDTEIPLPTGYNYEKVYDKYLRQKLGRV